MTKLVDVLVLGANVFDVWVRVPSRAFQIFLKGQQIGLAAQGRYPDGASFPGRGGAIPLIEGKKGERPRP